MKEYMKMADAFPHAKVGKSPVKPWVSGEYFVFYENQAEYAAHAINSHDELVAEVERLRQSLIDAATSLETIHVRSYGEGSFLDSKHEMRSYAGSRAKVARAALAEQ